jgi:DNA-binding SARP family transcriptional activator
LQRRAEAASGDGRFDFGSNVAIMLDVRLFGQPEVRYAGQPVKFAKRSTTLAMLAVLLLKRGHVVSRESLAFTLFPETDETAALGELRRYLYLANKALPECDTGPWIVTDADTVRWNDAAGASIDFIEFERLSGDAATYERAVDLYTGDLLESVYDDWALPERERLRSRYLNVLDRLVDRCRTERDYGSAIAYAKRILATDPWREDTLRILVSLRYESGDTAGALAEYDRFANQLRDELAISPMPETVAVRRSILRSEAVPGVPSPASVAAADSSPARVATVLPFVGRTREMASLTAAWGRAARGSGGMVLLGGEAGAGKSRLAAELARIAQGEGGRAFAGSTSAPESSPYQSIVGALRSGLPLLQARPLSGERRAVLMPLLPELADDAPAKVSFYETSPDRATTRVQEALSHAVATLATPRPLLLILEDLHWAGPATVEALGSIFRDIARRPVLIVATYRVEETPPQHPLRMLRRSLESHPNLTEIELDPLDETNVGELIERVEGLRERDAGLTRQLFMQSEGNALFLDEAIRAIAESRDPLDVSTSVSDVIASRVERLGQDGRTVAEIAAVAGSGCTLSLIREVSNLSTTSIARGLDELLDRRILREAGARSGSDYVFSHHLIADAVYSEIDPAFRAQRHLRIAHCLEAAQGSRGSASPQEIARHYERCGERSTAAQWYLTAAQSARDVHAHGDVITLASRSLENAETPEQRRSALYARESAHGRRGDREGQRADIELLETIEGNERPDAAFEVTLRRILLARSLGDSDEETAYLERLRALAEELDDDARAQASTQAATHASNASNAADAKRFALDALAKYERSGNVRGQLECLHLLVESTSNTGDLESSERYLALIQQRAGAVEDLAFEAHSLAVAAVAALLRQQYRGCFSLTQRSLELYVRANDREGQATARGRLAVTAAWLGDYTFALHEFDATLAMYEALGHKRGIALTHTNRVLLLLRIGSFAEALRSIDRSNELFEAVREKRTLVANRVNASFVHGQLGHLDVAKELAISALTLSRELGYPVFEAAALSTLGNAERRLGDFDAAIEHLEAGLAIRRPVQEPHDFVDDLTDLALAYVEAERPERALEVARELARIGAVSFDGALWPHYSWWAAAQGFRVAGAARDADAASARARSSLTSFAARIEDESLRTAFLELPANRAIADDA